MKTGGEKKRSMSNGDEEEVKEEEELAALATAASKTAADGRIAGRPDGPTNAGTEWMEEKSRLEERIAGLSAEISRRDAERSKWKGQNELLTVDLEEEKKLGRKTAGERDDLRGERDRLLGETEALKRQIEELKGKMKNAEEEAAAKRFLAEATTEGGEGGPRDRQTNSHRQRQIDRLTDSHRQ